MRTIFFLAALLLLTSCKRNPPNMDFNKDVELSGNVVADYYNKAAMDSLVAKIKAIPELTEDLKTARLDTFTEGMALDRIKKLMGKTKIPFDKGFGDFLIIDGNKNAARKWENKESKYGFDVKKYDIDDVWTFHDIELWKYHTGRYSPENDFDSIRKDEVKELKAVVQPEQAILKDVKYLVLMRDVLLKKPRITEGKSFVGGMLICEIKVFDFITGAKVAQGVVVARNEESVTDYSYGGKEEDEEFLFEDLLKARNEEVENFLYNKTPEELKKEKAERPEAAQRMLDAANSLQ